MKKLLFPLMIAVAVSMAACSSASQSVDPVTEAAVKTMIENRDFKIDIDQMIPRKGRTVSLTHPWNVRISGDSIYSYLPYMGEAYSAVFGSQDGLNFDGVITDYTVKQGRRGATDIRFRTRTFEDGYDYQFEIYPGGNTFLTVTPDKKSAVSFNGRMRIDNE